MPGATSTPTGTVPPDTVTPGRAAAPSPGPTAPEGWRTRLDHGVHAPRFQWTVIGVILVNAVVLGLLTTEWGKGDGQSLLNALDAACLVVYVVEIGLKLLAMGPRFFASGWNVFDFVIVAIALVPASGATGALRALRALRILRLISAFGSLRRVVTALFSAIPGMISILVILLLVNYVAAVMATTMFGEKFPEYFGSLGRSAYTLVQIMTLDSWSSGITRAVMDEYPWAWAFFVPYVAVAAFTVLNLFVAVIVDSMQTMRDQDPATGAAESATIEPTTTERPATDSPATAEQVSILQSQLAALEQSLAALHTKLAGHDPGDPNSSDPNSSGPNAGERNPAH